MDAKKINRFWMVGQQSASSLSEGGRHRKAQALPLSRMARSEARYSGSLQEMCTKGENIKERTEMTERYSVRKGWKVESLWLGRGAACV